MEKILRESNFGNTRPSLQKLGKRNRQRRQKWQTMALQVRIYIYFSFFFFPTLVCPLDYTQLAHKKYVRLMSEFKPDLSTYKEKQLEIIERAIRNGEDPSDVVAMANSLDYASVNDKPSKEAIEKLAAETKKQ
jgi:hypothetical protein